MADTDLGVLEYRLKLVEDKLDKKADSTEVQNLRDEIKEVRGQVNTLPYWIVGTGIIVVGSIILPLISLIKGGH